MSAEEGVSRAAERALESSSQSHVFNDDLLMNDGDLEFATSQFPEIIHILDYPRLRETFARYERRANKARDSVRQLGITAVVTSLLALIAVATGSIWQHISGAHWIALPIEIGGMLAGLISVGGLWLGPWKRRWLECRLMTERLRQWHFQIMVLRGEEIEASVAGIGSIAVFRRQRDIWFEGFLKAHEGKLDSQLTSVISEPGHTAPWLHSPVSTYSEKSTVLKSVFEAYELLRFDHQYNYAVYKLSNNIDCPVWRFWKWPANLQLAVFGNFAFVFFVAAFICSAILVYCDALDVGRTFAAYVAIATIVIALIGGALRTIQEGLAPDQEIERYNDYRTRTFHLRDRFRRAANVHERLHFMVQLELAAVDELAAFMRTHERARFVFQ
jgi:hypothetical protein